MLNAETTKEIQNTLVQIFPSNLILLGGSYADQKAVNDSDLDVFLICDWSFFFNRKKYQPVVADLKKKYPELQLMLVPKTFFKYGWYKVAGYDINGTKHASKITQKIVFRNAVKLAYFYLLKSIGSNRKDYWKKQSDKQAAIAKENSVGESAERLMSFSLPNYLIYNLKFISKGNFQFLFSNPDKKIISLLKEKVKQNSNVGLDEIEKIVFPVIIW
ncbi:MAG: nucleotidyltransferase domain-containing protein [Candidatus Magasanikbacteria bacterium]|nr:nucleotidyltransferase domain-containing protein [Candidatus Magasanikbacteria bacterium]